MHHSIFNAPPFATPLSLKNGHAQTLYAGTLFRPRPLPPQRRLKVPVEDNVSILCHYNTHTQDPARRCLILVHGLEGSVDSPYIISTAHKALDLGMDVVRMNLRGAGDSTHASMTPYHAGLSQDLEAVCQAVIDLGYTHIFLGGFSLGAHLLLKMLACATALPPEIKGACAVSPPLELALASERIMRWDNAIYERHFFLSMQKTYRQRRRYWPEHTHLPTLAKTRNLRDFDNLITGPAFGYQDANDYYTQNSVLQWWRHIKTPTRIVYSSDDPIIPVSSHLKAMAMHNPHVHWLMTTEGGHVGFLNQKKLAQQDRDRLWGENRLLDFALARLDLD